MTKNIRTFVVKSLDLAINCHYLTSGLISSTFLSRTAPTYVLLLFLYLNSFSVLAQNGCTISNHAFSEGEELRFKVVYNWGPIWLESAEARFNVNSGNYSGKKCYVFTGKGNTYPRYDWFFKVNDEFETYVDTLTFRPLKFRADIYEGSKQDKHLYLFNNAHHKVYTIINYGAQPVKVDTLSVNPCSIDVLTAIYFARNLDYSQCRVNDTIGISIVLDGKLVPLYVRYLGKEVFTSEELGTYRCIKFRPLLVEGTIFKKGEHMNVWVTDDLNKVPLYIETSIIVGSVKVSLTGYKGLRNPQVSKLK
ncbi:MAG: DUF3108 domain-containing protein [bacterium]|nr:DUF3108 domain-containing protein [bacterium]